MTLRFDPQSRRYVGARYSIERTSFVRRLWRLLGDGRGPEDAFAYLADEDNWAADLPGVRAAGEPGRCSACGAELQQSPAGPCTLLCAAGVVVEQYLAEQAAQDQL